MIMSSCASKWYYMKQQAGSMLLNENTFQIVAGYSKRTHQ